MLKQALVAALAAAAVALPARAQDAYVIGVTGALTGPSAGTNAPPIEGAARSTSIGSTPPAASTARRSS